MERQEHDGRRKERAVEDIEDPAHPGKYPAGILDARAALHQAFGKVAEGTHHAEHGAGRFALGVGERRKGVESPIEIRRAVDEYEVDLIHDGFLIKAGRWLNTVRLINE